MKLIKAALLASFSQKHDPFVIIEGDCNCFVQFMQENGALNYDFPNGDLEEKIYKKAKSFHSERGIEYVEVEDIDPDTMKKFKFHSWQKAFSRDQIDVGVDTALLALYEIYGQDGNTEFKITRGWE